MTEIVSLGTLVNAPLRSAWPHEAGHFTPWLAQNLSLLSDAIGIPMELVATVERATLGLIAPKWTKPVDWAIWKFNLVNVA